MALDKAMNATGKGLWAGTKALGRNTVSSYTNPFHGKGGFSVLGAGIGMAGGALTAGMVPYGMDPMAGAAVGAAAGGLSLPMLGGAGALGVGALTSMYKNPIRTAGGFGGAGRIGAISAGVGAVASGGDPTATIGIGLAGAALGAAGGAIKPGAVGATAAGAAKGIGKLASGVASTFVDPELGRIGNKGGIGGPLHRYGNLAGRALGGVMKFTPEQSYFDEKKNKIVTKRGKMGLTKKGLVAGSLIGLGVMAKGGAEDIYESRAGSPTGTTRATPNYLDVAGATGDLVFAMHQNRRG